jgi:hypothetical protein
MRPPIHGYKDMGRIRIPPLPLALILYDRADGQPWFLTRNEDATEIELSTDLYRHPDRAFFGPFDGPYTNGKRLFVSAGTLQFEDAEGHFSPPVMARGPAFQRLLGRITVEEDEITITPVQL